MDNVILAIIGLFQAVAVAVIGGIVGSESKKRKKHNDKMEKRSAIRSEESRLAMKLMSANASLSVATALALKEGKTNGKTEKALEEVSKAQGEYYAFINRVASEQISKE